MKTLFKKTILSALSLTYNASNNFNNYNKPINDKY